MTPDQTRYERAGAASRFTKTEVEAIIQRRLQDQMEHVLLRRLEERMDTIEKLVVDNGWQKPLGLLQKEVGAVVRRLELIEEDRRDAQRFHLADFGQPERDAILPMAQWWVRRGKRMPLLTSNLTIISLVVGIIFAVFTMLYNLLTTTHSSVLH